VAEESGFQVGPDAPRFYEEQVGRFMVPFASALVTATVAAGDAVLDVACGTGFATRAAAAIAGAGARVEGSDLNPAMVAHARTVADGSGADLRWREASALELPYGDGEFDAVICQQGLQFFPDPAAGVEEMIRVTRSGGRVGVTVWAPSELSPFLHHETEMLAQYGGGAPARWSATEQQLRDWFAGAGAADVSVELLTIDVELPPVRSYVPEHLLALPWSADFRALPQARRSAALAALDSELAEHRTDEGLRVPFSSYLAVTAV
jgi:SAM-dependent methyltransferase